MTAGQFDRVVGGAVDSVSRVPMSVDGGTSAVDPQTVPPDPVRLFNAQLPAVEIR